jgi:catechol 2,3-dioxygenase-like lactoylglutathione lyase family enzyme
VVTGNPRSIITRSKSIPFMKIEHTAYNVADPVAVAAWYCEHCGLKIVRHLPQSAQTHFLSDGSGSILEIYCNPPDMVPDYQSMNPLLFHLAFASPDPVADQTRLTGAGATFHSEVKSADGTHLVMMRDPWGLAIQLCRRSAPLEKRKAVAC